MNGFPVRTKCIIYCQYDHTRNSHMTLELQQQYMTQQCQNANFDVHAIIHEICPDNTPLIDREGMTTLVSNAYQSNVSVIMIYKVHHCSISAEEFIQFFLRLKKNRVRLISLDLPNDSLVSPEEYFSHVITSLAQYKRELFSASLD